MEASMETNKVRVRIYGQEYVISGEQTDEHITKVAEYVDFKMREIDRFVSSGQVSMVAVLAAVNVADEYFKMIDDVSELKRTKERLENDVAHYLQMWEEAKKSFLQYKEDTQGAIQKKEALTGAVAEKDQEIERLKRLVEAVEAKTKRISAEEKKALQDKLKEIEDNYFDLQMENVQLKSEIERFKR
jgi:cell division protein ZapA